MIIVTQKLLPLHNESVAYYLFGEYHCFMLKDGVSVYNARIDYYSNQTDLFSLLIYYS